MEIIQIDRSQSALVFELFDQYRVFYKQESNIERAKAFIQARLDNNESVIFVALSSDKTPVGFTQLYPKYSSARTVKNWILNDLFVLKEYRKHGVGESLIKTAMNFGKKNHATFVELSTAVDNYVAQKLYEQVGFKKQGPDNEFYTYRIDL